MSTASTDKTRQYIYNPPIITTGHVFLNPVLVLRVPKYLITLLTWLGFTILQ